MLHQAYVRLADQSSISMEHRAQFFGLAAKIMRDILVDHARKRQAAKRGGQQFRLSLTEAERFGRKPEGEMIALDDALNSLATTNPKHSRVVELRFFDGLNDRGNGPGDEPVARYDGTFLEFCPSLVAPRVGRLER